MKIVAPLIVMQPKKFVRLSLSYLRKRTVMYWTYVIHVRGTRTRNRRSGNSIHNLTVQYILHSLREGSRKQVSKRVERCTRKGAGAADSSNSSTLCFDRFALRIFMSSPLAKHAKQLTQSYF